MRGGGTKSWFTQTANCTCWCTCKCMTKHSPDYKVLMLGRVLGGIATSLLFSAFESWLVAEHFKVCHELRWFTFIDCRV